MSSEITDAEVVDAHGTDLVPVNEPRGNLFKSDDPVEVIERASRVADVLKSVLERQGLTANISGKSHVLVEGWTTCGALIGVVPVVEWTRPTEDGWEARVVAKTMDGRVIGAAEASCTREERRWKTAEAYAIRSMAQTRATSKALRGPLGFIVTLAGFQATPAEEMPQDSQPAQEQLPPYGPNRAEDVVSAASAACVQLRGGDVDAGKALWMEIVGDLGYMPQASAVALICASSNPEPAQ